MKVLEKAFVNLTAFATDHFKLCFFVDDLDEFNGDAEVLTELFLKVSKSLFVKVCLSSRLLIVFSSMP